MSILVVSAGCATTTLRLWLPPVSPSGGGHGNTLGSSLDGLAASVRRADRALRAGRPERAEEAAREALARDPHLAVAHEVLAEIARLRDDGPTERRHWIGALADGRSTRVGLYLAELCGWTLDRRERETLAGLLTDIIEHHPSPLARDAARRFAVGLALGLGQRGVARRISRETAVIRRWRVVAGFDNDQNGGYDTPYGPEHEVNLDHAYPTSRGQTTWREITDLGVDPSLDLSNHFYPFRSNIAYLLTYVRSPKARKVTLTVQTSDPIKVWINDRIVLASRAIRGPGVRPLRVSGTLAAGFNKILIKTCQGAGVWRLGVAFADETGRPLRLGQSLQPRPYVRDRRGPLSFDPQRAVRADV
ncbi:MAG: hypothetical protein KAI47_07625, partial [Deltaproteobacteria bacterium]|nr:hypothetical protein [Deltaproteobacteria bacterium]